MALLESRDERLLHVGAAALEARELPRPGADRAAPAGGRVDDAGVAPSALRQGAAPLPVRLRGGPGLRAVPGVERDADHLAARLDDLPGLLRKDAPRVLASVSPGPFDEVGEDELLLRRRLGDGLLHRGPEAAVAERAELHALPEGRPQFATRVKLGLYLLIDPRY